VVAVDIGSVRSPSKFAWAGFDAPGRDLVNTGEDPETAVSMLAPGLLAGGQAALLASGALHRRIVQIGCNTLLREVNLALLALFDAGTESVVPGSKPPAYRQEGWPCRRALVEAIESGNEAQCARATRKHADGHDR
jgi:DNA-binding FadR family transcriptional regulator